MNRNLLPGGILTFVLFFVKVSQMYAVVPSTDGDPIKVIVTNTSDIVNGNTQNIGDLTSNPGPDGISFREAIYACNGTTGEKIINFDSSLKGDTIFVTSTRLSLTSGELVIDGDIDKDGKPDITLNGGISMGMALNYLSSDNTVTGLNFYDFFNTAILFTCPDQLCGTKLFTNNSFIKNTITSSHGSGISVSTLGIVMAEDNPKLSDVTWNGVVINGNSITTGETAISLCAASGGADRNKILNATISDNYLSSSGTSATLDVIVADVNSKYFRTPGPTNYSDSSLVDNLIISNNMIEAPNGGGIHINCTNYGNKGNILRNVKISRNNITNIKIGGIYLTVGNDDGNFDRPTNSNLVSQIEISQNTIAKTWIGILLSGVDSGTGVGANFNKAENVTISQNQISDYLNSGILIVGGVSNSPVVSGNILDTITISDNKIFQTLNQGTACGIKIEGGISYNGSSLQNIIKGLHIINNKISKNHQGIQILGGEGAGANDNQVILAEIHGNFLLDNNVPSDIQNNLSGATNNSCSPTIPVIKDTISNSHCGIGSVELGASASAGIINWYADPEGGNSIATGTSFVTPDLTSITAYYVDATDNGCTTLTRTAVTATILGPDLCQTLNEEISSSDRIKIYPNPTDGKLEVLMLEPFSSDFRIEVYNGHGRLIQTITMCKSENNALIDLSRFSAGIYLIKIISKTDDYHFSVIKK